MSAEAITLAKHFANCITLRVAELPDRTSPEDWPEAMLVTAEELAQIVEDELIENIAEGHSLAQSQAREAELREALRPFAGVAFEGLASDTDVVQYRVITRGPGHATVADFRRARSVYGGE